MADHEIVDDLLAKYADELAIAYTQLGYNSVMRDSGFITDLLADLYLEYGLEKWGDQYDIVLGGGYLNTRSPGQLNAGFLLYSDILSVLPFDNEIYLCTIPGSTLLSQFMNNSKYTVSYSTYGSQIASQINANSTYYVIVDSYTLDYAPNNLTAVECLNPNLYARDLIAQYCIDGYLDESGTTPPTSYSWLTVEEAIALGETYAHNTFSEELYYIEGTVTEIASSTYGNMYIRDAYGNEIFIYGLKNIEGNWYFPNATTPVEVGDTIIILTCVGYYDSYAELKNAILISIV